ncbi:MAG: hypothetical protein M3401_14805 [Actinomycetota bacterium]|nr:hypothetical protein [Actinomycetota bacterium]
MEAMAMHGAATRPGVRMLTTLGGVVLVAQGVAAAATEQNTKYAGSTGDVLSDGLLAGGLLLTLAGLEALRRVLSRRMAALAMVGQVALLASILATVAAGREALDAVFVVGTLVWLVGLIGIAVAVARSRERFWRAAIALPLAGLAALAFQDAGGAALLGLVWIVLGARSATQR